ncbi:MAG TPA: FprA family A-type flavoprotein [Anaerolineaceae bacterium]|jgi:flavorubredoxin|nr:FprA family A-type flavoprotein [Anaerolineales bacterium]HPY33858.1 FprA family A-type flavoprotein [Anaerolineaceae bacterium]HQC20835.1 FprA family A-type flavoprotein [Anaerolineaceae bacterium]HQK42305.1 FprA family A-type flavoprotein [Anaerolineaceae bacterium]
MRPIEIRPNIYWVGVNDRSSELFEGLWPIQNQGVTYNAYLIKDEKNALIDLSKEAFTDDFIAQLESLVGLENLNYVITNHMEPDHTGALLRLRECAPNAVFLGMGKAVAMMKDFYGLVDNVAVLKHEDTLSLGKNTLKFLFTPLVHWPETMMTYMVEEKILFSCDAFGSYGCLDGFLFDDEASDRDYFEREALRYFTNIVAAFSRNVLMAIDKVSPYPIEILAPSHGLVWRKEPERIISLYKKWAAMATEPAEPGVTVLYGSMYRNTERALDFALQAVAEQGVPLEVFNVAVTDPSFILPSLWTKRGLLVACPTYERAMFPPMVHALNIAEIKGVRNKIAGYFGSYAWSGGAKAVFEEFAAKLNWDVVGALEFIGSAKEADIQQIQAISRQIAGRSK